MSNFLNQLLKERAFEKRGVFNRIQSSTVCNASATNPCRIPVFPLFSVTRTLIGYNYIRSRRRKALHGLSGQMFWEVFVFLKAIIENKRVFC